MKFIDYILFLIVCFSISCESSNKDTALTLSLTPPTVIAENGNELFQYWEIENCTHLWEYNLGEVPALMAYRDSVSKSIGDSVLNEMIRKERTQLEPDDTHDSKDSLNNYDLIHKGYIGAIREINFIEAELLNYQISRFPLFSQPTEFHGFIVENDSLEIVRIYFGASDQPWPPKPKPIISHLENALNNGWHLTSHLHNHYEPASKNYLGVIAPSLADAQYFKALKARFNLPTALITNGFSTVSLKSTEFGELNSH